jgi:hypothetical protein
MKKLYLISVDFTKRCYCSQKRVSKAAIYILTGFQRRWNFYEEICEKLSSAAAFGILLIWVLAALRNCGFLHLLNYFRTDLENASGFRANWHYY